MSQNMKNVCVCVCVCVCAWERERERENSRYIRNIPDCSAEAIELRKMVIYHSSEYWYMGSILDRSVVQKKSS